VDLGFANATAVVVGGGRGMGLATARCLAKDGTRVVVVGRSKAVLDEAADELSRSGSPVHVVSPGSIAVVRSRLARREHRRREGVRRGGGDRTRAHPRVADALVVGRDSERWGQEVVALVEVHLVDPPRRTSCRRCAPCSWRASRRRRSSSPSTRSVASATARPTTVGPRAKRCNMRRWLNKGPHDTGSGPGH
jgi:hypothetical protein